MRDEGGGMRDEGGKRGSREREEEGFKREGGNEMRKEISPASEMRDEG